MDNNSFIFPLIGEPSFKEKRTKARDMAELEQQKKQAKEEGKRLGLEEGRQTGRTEEQEKIVQMNQILSALALPMEQINQDIIEQIYTLTVSIAKHLFLTELEDNPAILKNAITEGLKQLPALNEPVEIRMNPEVLQALENIEDLNGLQHSIQFIPDPSCATSSIYFHQAQGDAQFSLDDRLAQVMKGLTNDWLEAKHAARGHTASSAEPRHCATTSADPIVVAGASSGSAGANIKSERMHGAPWNPL